MIKMSICPKMCLLARSRILLKIVIFYHRGHIQSENFNFSQNVGPVQDFAHINCHFWPPWICRRWKIQFWQMYWPDQWFCSKLSFFKDFAQNGHFLMILLKIVIFDQHGHVEDENLNFSKNVAPMKDFAQNCNFLRILLKIVIF